MEIYVLPTFIYLLLLLFNLFIIIIHIFFVVVPRGKVFGPFFSTAHSQKEKEICLNHFNVLGLTSTTTSLVLTFPMRQWTSIKLNQISRKEKGKLGAHKELEN